jgi:hypothetical protein
MSSTLAPTLAEEVADLIRHDNLDTRILTWLRMAFNDMVSRMPVWRFNYPNMTAFGVTGTSGGVESGGLDLTSLDYQDVVVGLVSANSGTLYVPRYVPWGHFRSQYHNRASAAPVTGVYPEVWSIGPDSRYQASTLATGRTKIYVWPVPATGASFQFTVYSRRAGYSTDVTTSRYPLPYHMEHALVWGAAYFAAKALRPQLAQVFMAEYEQAVQNLSWILTYKPDATPVMRSNRGVYDGSSRLSTIPRIPTNIPSP